LDEDVTNILNGSAELYYRGIIGEIELHATAIRMGIYLRKAGFPKENIKGFLKKWVDETIQHKEAMSRV
jgi:hypothetical protein